MATLVITPEIEDQAHRLAELTGKRPQQALADAVSGTLLAAVPAENPQRIDWKMVDAIVGSLRGKLDLTLSEDEILGYDEFGLPGASWSNDRR